MAMDRVRGPAKGRCGKERQERVAQGVVWSKGRVDVLY